MRVGAPLGTPDAELLKGMWCMLTPALMLGPSNVLLLALGVAAGSAISVALLLLLLLLRAMLSADSMCSLDWKRPWIAKCCFMSVASTMSITSRRRSSWCAWLAHNHNRARSLRAEEVMQSTTYICTVAAISGSNIWQQYLESH
jgi:nicotinamide riboside transporter PnuC